jgi:hypothetical protein
MLNTEKQQAIMKLVLAAADEGRFISLRELKARYAPDISTQAVICSISFLVKHGLVIKVYGEEHGEYKPGTTMYIKPTPEAYSVYRPGKVRLALVI